MVEAGKDGMRLSHTSSAPESGSSHRIKAASIAAESVRAACLDAAIQAYEDAGIRGLCADGRWEAALAAIRLLDLSGARPVGRISPADPQP